METVSCNLCGSSSSTLLFTSSDQVFGRGEEFGIVKCDACDLVYLSPRPTADEMGAYYPPEYQEEIRKLIDRMRSNALLQKGLAMLRKRRSPPDSPPGRVLDIGCSFGDYLLYLQARGWTVEGIEKDPDAARHAKDSGLAVYAGDAADVLPTLPAERFDIVTLWQVLEHMVDPLGCLQEVHRILRPGGMVMLEVPNFACLAARWFGPSWFPLEIPRHLFHFTPETLTKMLARTGYSLLPIEWIPSPEALVWSLRLLRNRRRGSSDGRAGGSLSLNPFMATLAFPVSWALSRMGQADHMGIRARKNP